MKRFKLSPVDLVHRFIGLALFALIALLPLVAHASAGNNNLKIVAYYGAGNLSKSEYGRDTILLFNPTQAPIAMNGWSIQTGSTSGAFTSAIYQLPNVTIPAGGYYAIAASGASYTSGSACTGVNCNTNYAYDYELKTIEGTATATDNILASTATTIALANTTSPLGSCPTTSTGLVDMLGVGAVDGSAVVTCWAGGGSAPYTPSSLNGATTSIHSVVYAYGTVRKNRCIDTFNNAADYQLGYIDFENSASTPKPCPTGNQLTVSAAQAVPSKLTLNTASLITANVTPATSPASTGLTVTADLTNLGLSATTQLYDDGTHGDITANDGVYSATITPTKGTGEVLGLIVTATDTQGDTATSSIPASVGGNVPGPGNNNLRIVAWYGAGNLSGSQYARDTVILFNPTQAAIAMNSWSLQTGSTTGSFTTVYQLPNTTIPAGGYYAIAGSGTGYISSSGCSSTDCQAAYAYDYQLKTQEGTATTTDNDLSSTAVSVALVDQQTALGSGCPWGSPHMIDMVGIGAYDGSAVTTCYAGTNFAPYTPATLNGAATSINGVKYAYATVRNSRCLNTYDNGADFSLNYIDFKNSTSTPEPCSGGTQFGLAASATPNSLGVTESFTISAAVTPATSPQSTGVAVTADLTNIGLAAGTPLYDDGTHGDAVAGDNVYSLTTAVSSASVGTTEGLSVTAADSQGNKASRTFPLTIEAGTISMTSNTYTATVNSGDVAKFLLTVVGAHGYGGTLGITCVGSPNANNNGIPVSTQCVPTPGELVLTNNGTGTISLAIATGLTVQAQNESHRRDRNTLLAVSFGTLLLVGFARRRRRLPALMLIAIAGISTLGLSGCGKNAGLGNVNAAKGTYTFTLTATDSAVSTITSAVTLTVNVQ
ncbi:MAG: lamin tail domain-containing protein [Acidobacteriaceae bacterium]|nr:lamin tail domain-containing protein [Acidobacteriaceae bacterium]